MVQFPKQTKERDTITNFEDIFDACMGEALRENALKNKVVDKDKLKVLEGACDALSKMSGYEADLKLYPGYGSGAVVIETEIFDLDENGVKKLTEALGGSSNFAVEPLANGKVSVSISFEHMFKKQ